MSRTDAVEALYQDMAARHRSRFGSIHVRFSNQPRLELYSNNFYRSSRLLRSRTTTASAAPTSSSSSRRTSSSLCPTALVARLARRSSLTLAPRPLLKCIVLGLGLECVDE